MIERDEQVIEIAKGIAKRLGASWSVIVSEHNIDIRCTDGRELSIGRPYKAKDRVEVRASGWPTFKELKRDYRGNEYQAHRVTPRDLYDPQESTPEATVAIARGIDAICKEVGRRIMADYARIWTRCQEKARQSQEYQDKRDAAWARVCAAADKGGDARYVDMLGLTLGPSNGDSVYAERGGSMNADDVIAVIELLKARHAKKGAA